MPLSRLDSTVTKYRPSLQGKWHGVIEWIQTSIHLYLLRILLCFLSPAIFHRLGYSLISAFPQNFYWRCEERHTSANPLLFFWPQLSLWWLWESQSALFFPFNSHIFLILLQVAYCYCCNHFFSWGCHKHRVFSQVQFWHCLFSSSFSVGQSWAKTLKDSISYLV